MYYRLTFQNDNGYAFDHIDYRSADGDGAVYRAATLSSALHPIGASGHYTFRKLSNDELGPRKPELTSVANSCLQPGDVMAGNCPTAQGRVVHCQTRGRGLTRGFVRRYLEDPDGTVYHSLVPASEMVEVLR